MTSGLVGRPAKSTVFRSLWQVKKCDAPRGNSDNIGPDLQELLTGITVLVWCEGSGEPRSDTLEQRVRRALEAPDAVQRFGGWALGESTHLIDAVGALPGEQPPLGSRVFLLDVAGP